MMVVWDVESGKSLYGTPNRDPIVQLKFFNNDEDRLVALQDKGVELFTIDKVNKKVSALSLSLSHFHAQARWRALALQAKELYGCLISPFKCDFFLFFFFSFLFFFRMIFFFTKFSALVLLTSDQEPERQFRKHEKTVPLCGH